MLQKTCGASQVVADDFLQLESIFKKPMTIRIFTVFLDEF
jgi:hypothetical protein